MRVAIASVQVPFVRGGAELLAEGLKEAIEAAGHQACIVTVPFKWYPPERIPEAVIACRLLDLTESSGSQIDRVIGVKFPAYLIPHPNKVLWIAHQHRAAYDLWEHSLGDLRGHPRGAQVRDAIRLADRRFIPEARSVYAISGNVSYRLREFCAIDAEPLYHPPSRAGQFWCDDEVEERFFFPSRLHPTKRQSLVIEALACTRRPVRVAFAGQADTPGFADELTARARLLGVAGRIDWLGRIDEHQLLRHYARALAVVYPPTDEDYGYVTLEAMLAAKAVVTCADSGGTLEFVRAGETGLVAEPTRESLAAALDELWDDRARAGALGRAAREHYRDLDIGWDKVVGKLLA